MVQWCWVDFQCLGILQVWKIIGQEPIAIAVEAGGEGGEVDIFFSRQSSSLSPSL